MNSNKRIRLVASPLASNQDSNITCLPLETMKLICEFVNPTAYLELRVLIGSFNQYSNCYEKLMELFGEKVNHYFNSESKIQEIGNIETSQNENKKIFFVKDLLNYYITSHHFYHNSYLQMIQYLLDNKYGSTYESELVLAAKLGKLDVVILLYKYHPRSQETLNQVLNAGYSNGHENIISWCDIISPIDLSNNNQAINLFIYACKRGFIDMAKWVYRKIPSIIKLEHNDFSNPMEIMMLDYNLSDEYKTVLFKAILNVCQEGHCDILKWLLGLAQMCRVLGVNINIDFDCAFRIACQHGHTACAITLFMSQTNPQVINTRDIFIHFCQSYDDRDEDTHSEIFVWLASLHRTDIKNGFIESCKFGSAKFIHLLYKNFPEELDDNTLYQGFLAAWIDGELCRAPLEWFLTMGKLGNNFQVSYVMNVNDLEVTIFNGNTHRIETFEDYLNYIVGYEDSDDIRPYYGSDVHQMIYGVQNDSDDDSDDDVAE
jgi:hypothetical protein